ncbi:MAG: hypothetical protein ABSF25_24165 [Bryobacteraceae bacterium]|jgi:hypothetical protein
MFATALLNREASHDAPPVCLGRENPNRLVSLWDMLQFLARDFVAIMQNLRLIEEKLTIYGSAAYDSSEVGAILGHLRHECISLELPSATKQVRRIESRFTQSVVPGLDAKEALSLLSELRRRVVSDT